MYRFKYQPQLQSTKGKELKASRLTQVSQTATVSSECDNSAPPAADKAQKKPLSAVVAENPDEDLLNPSSSPPPPTHLQAWQLQTESMSPLSPDTLQELLNLTAAALAHSLPQSSSDGSLDAGAEGPGATEDRSSGPAGPEDEQDGEDLPTLLPITPPPDPAPEQLTEASEEKKEKTPLVQDAEAELQKSGATPSDTLESDEEKEDFYLRHQQYRRGLLVSTGSGSDTDVSEEDSSDERPRLPKNPLPRSTPLASSDGKYTRPRTDNRAASSVRPAFRRRIFQQRQQRQMPSRKILAPEPVDAQDHFFPFSSALSNLEGQRSDGRSEKPPLLPRQQLQQQEDPEASSHSFGDQDDRHSSADSSSDSLLRVSASSSSSVSFESRSQDTSHRQQHLLAPFPASAWNSPDPTAHRPSFGVVTGHQPELLRLDPTPGPASLESWTHSPRTPRFPSVSSPSTPVLRPSADPTAVSSNNTDQDSISSSNHGWPHGLKRASGRQEEGNGLRHHYQHHHYQQQQQPQPPPPQSPTAHKSTPLPYFMRVFHPPPSLPSPGDLNGGDLTPSSASGGGLPRFSSRRSSHQAPGGARGDLVDVENDSVVEEDLLLQGRNRFRRRRSGSSGYSSSSSVGSVGDGRFGNSIHSSGGYSPFGGGRDFLLLPHSDSSSPGMVGSGSYSGSTASSPKHASGLGGFRSQKPQSFQQQQQEQELGASQRSAATGEYLKQSCAHQNHHYQPLYSSRRPLQPPGTRYSEAFPNRFTSARHPSEQSGSWTDGGSGSVETVELEQPRWMRYHFPGAVHSSSVPPGFTAPPGYSSNSRGSGANSARNRQQLFQKQKPSSGSSDGSRSSSFRRSAEYEH